MNNYLNEIYQELNALYWANNGQISLAAPLKMYQGFMIDKLNQNHSSCLKKLVLRIIHVATGLFAYPILGALAAFNMACVSLDWNLNKRGFHNEKEKNYFILVRKAIHESSEPTSKISLSYKINPDGPIKDFNCKVFREYEIKFGPEESKGMFDEKKDEFINQMESIIDQFTKCYTEVYVNYQGTWQDGIKFTFLAKDSSLPYCSNPLLPTYKKIIYPPVYDSNRLVEVIE